ncbi:TIM44-like domain-containing protein, partial [bacterium]|nr:TIM44-like domain-containing protein [bacterium]
MKYLKQLIEFLKTQMVRRSWLIPIFLLYAMEVFARAGGGGGYHSSGGGGGGGGGGGYHSSSGGGGDGGDLILRLIIELVFRYPWIGVPLLIAFIFFTYYGSLEGKEQYVDYTIRKGVKAQNNVKRLQAEASIRSRDPAWQSGQFVERVKNAFKLIQKGWSDQDLSGVQAFISDGIYERFTLQISEQKDFGYRNKLEDVRILEARIAQIQTDKHFDTAHVYFRASLIDSRVDLKSGKCLEGQRKAEEFEEYWSFIRKPGAKTLNKPGLI